MWPCMADLRSKGLMFKTNMYVPYLYMCTRSVQLIQDNVQDSFAITFFYANMMCGLYLLARNE